ncbi:MAG TPA: UDP-3-O-(3-hydroxymyristoyl)glucosamine N-acyltransferase [Desulfobacteraceae bacterium]|nr:MAG: UDP-3-O-(3-hydroxymyristoyl)glucosamine N-acyltransferase [Deltaproteobacteria bacterium]HDZ23414.1 UDP-3-O-(3-hydroxymyristoyl)glucosamine N-acyltransferase [Desulfobacteraceae bacterium]
MEPQNKGKKAQGISLQEIARLIDGEVIGDEMIRISGINALDAAGPGEISFLTSSRYQDRLSNTLASAVILQEKTALYDGAQVIVADPKRAYPKVASLFAPDIPRFPGVSEQASCHGTCRIGKRVSIYPNVFVGEDAEIGDESILFPGVYVGNRVRIGRKTVLYPNVTVLDDCQIGNEVIIHAGTVIGSDGFGFVQEGGHSMKIPQLGIVHIDDQVEIGANNCIDRAAFGKTWIQRGVKTDNLVQIAHNVIIGEDSIIVAQAGISGSVKIGRQVMLGGQVGVADHLEIGDRVMIASQSGVAKSIEPGQIVSGTPTMPHRLWLRASSLFQHLPEFSRRLRGLEKRLDSIEMRGKKE